MIMRADKAAEQADGYYAPPSDEQHLQFLMRQIDNRSKRGQYDVATTLMPDSVLARLESAGFIVTSNSAGDAWVISWHYLSERP